MTDQWSADVSDTANAQSQCYQPKQRPSLEEQVGEAGVAQLIAKYRGGATQQELADRHRVSVSSVKRLLRKHGVRLRLAEEMRTRARQHD